MFSVGQASGLFSSIQLSDKLAGFYSLPLNVYYGHPRNSGSESETRTSDAQGTTLQLRRTANADNNHNHSFSSAPRAIWTLDNEDVLSLNSFISLNASNNRSRTQTVSEVGTFYPFVFEDHNTKRTPVRTSAIVCNGCINLVIAPNWNYVLVRIIGTQNLPAIPSVERAMKIHFCASCRYRKPIAGWSSSGKQYSAPYIDDHVLSFDGKPHRVGKAAII